MYITFTHDDGEIAHLSFRRVAIKTRYPHPVTPALTVVLFSAFDRHLKGGRRVCVVDGHGVQ